MEDRIISWEEKYPPMSEEERSVLQRKLDERQAWEEGRLQIAAPNSAYQV